MERTSWQTKWKRTQGLNQRTFIEKSISKDIQGPTRTLGTLMYNSLILKWRTAHHLHCVPVRWHIDMGQRPSSSILIWVFVSLLLVLIKINRTSLGFVQSVLISQHENTQKRVGKMIRHPHPKHKHITVCFMSLSSKVSKSHDLQNGSCLSKCIETDKNP